MSAPRPHDDITMMLAALGDGSPGSPEGRDALAALVPLVYDELHRLASSYMRHEHRVQTIQTTALVHEAYLRLAEQHHVRWQNRAHFFGIAAQAMRRILVSRARAAHADKRGRGVEKVSIDDVQIANPDSAVDLVALDYALEQLALIDPQQARIVEMRFFAGLTVEEVGAVLKVSSRTIKREWRIARAWLKRALEEGPSQVV